MSRNPVSILRENIKRASSHSDYDYHFEIEDDGVRTEDNGIKEYDVPAEILDALGVEGIEYGDAGITLRFYKVPGADVTQIMMRVRDYD